MHVVKINNVFRFSSNEKYNYNLVDEVEFIKKERFSKLSYVVIKKFHV